MPKSTQSIVDETKSDKRPRSSSRETAQVPVHFAVHKPGCHFESCCGVCNLFPGVLLIAFCQVLVGSVLLTLLLSHGKQYDTMHGTTGTQLMSMTTGAVLSGVTGAGVLLIVVALTENCRAMLVYLLAATLVMMSIFCLGLVKIARACALFKEVSDGLLPRAVTAGFAAATPGRLKEGSGQQETGTTAPGPRPAAAAAPLISEQRSAAKIKDMQHRMVNLACVSGLSTFFGGVVYWFSFIVVFSFYHFRYVRRAILLHEAECE